MSFIPIVCGMKSFDSSYDTVPGHQNLYCPNCHNYSVGPIKRKEFFTIWFIPLVPVFWENSCTAPYAIGDKILRMTNSLIKSFKNNKTYDKSSPTDNEIISFSSSYICIYIYVFTITIRILYRSIDTIFPYVTNNITMHEHCFQWRTSERR